MCVCIVSNCATPYNTHNCYHITRLQPFNIGIDERHRRLQNEEPGPGQQRGVHVVTQTCCMRRLWAIVHPQHTQNERKKHKLGISKKWKSLFETSCLKGKVDFPKWTIAFWKAHEQIKQHSHRCFKNQITLQILGYQQTLYMIQAMPRPMSQA